DEAPDLDVLVQEVGVVLRREPARRPCPGRAEAEADRMRLLTHRLFLLLGLASAPGGRLGRGRRCRGRPGGRPPRCGGRGPGAARPIARGCTRFIEGPPSAMACTTRRSSRLRTWWLCSAFATAERSTFSTRRAAARGVYSSVARASPTDLPRIWSRTSRAFRAE